MRLNPYSRLYCTKMISDSIKAHIILLQYDYIDKKHLRFVDASFFSIDFILKICYN